MAKPSASPDKATADPKKVYDHAERFCIADRLLRSERFEPRVTEVVMLPAAALSAFSSELFMKCLLLLEGKAFEKTHNLSELFEKMETLTRSKIVALWDAEIAIDKDQLDQLEAAAGVPLPRDLPSALKACGDAFIELRYVYEDPMKGNFLMAQLPMMLREVVLEFRPDWQ